MPTVRVWATIVVLALPAIGLAQAPGETIRVSVRSDGTQSDGSSFFPCISRTGRFVCFLSRATNLGGEVDRNGAAFYVHDRQTGATRVLSLPQRTRQFHTGIASLSNDGRLVAFAAMDSITGVINVYVRDLLTGVDERASVGFDGIESDGDSEFPRLSASGRFVTYVSTSPNLVEGDQADEFTQQVYLHDRRTEVTERISETSEGLPANFLSFVGSVSKNGRYVSFSSTADNLVEGDANRLHDEFLLDRRTGILTRISMGLGGVETDGRSIGGTVSDNGRFVVFGSEATNLVEGDTNERTDVFVFNRRSGVIERVSVGMDGEESNGFSGDAWISRNGRLVSFSSTATNLVANDTNDETDCFVYDRRTGITRRVSTRSGPALTPGETGSCSSAQVSANGRYVAFASTSPSLVEGDTNAVQDIFLHRIPRK